ncbi:MAG TPA: hypothetical protein DCQ64_23895 [Candidatus Rokubacteria bacterium]|nr:hypothetical protein [Candidatus Rokubacteria bacterium]
MSTTNFTLSPPIPTTEYPIHPDLAAYCSHLAARNGRTTEQYVQAFRVADAAEAEYIRERLARYREPWRMSLRRRQAIQIAAHYVGLEAYKATLAEVER